MAGQVLGGSTNWCSGVHCWRSTKIFWGVPIFSRTRLRWQRNATRCLTWRPNLPDEADNHLIELGVAAQAIVTRNLRDVSR